MPDVNKISRLREIRYEIPVTCALCVHGEFRPALVWGTCARHRYAHAKHANPVHGRGVSVVAYGTCADAELDPSKESTVGAHAEFLRR